MFSVKNLQWLLIREVAGCGLNTVCMESKGAVNSQAIDLLSQKPTPLISNSSFFLPYSFGPGFITGQQLRSWQLYLYVTQHMGSIYTHIYAHMCNDMD